MDDAVNVWVLLKHLVEGGFVGNIEVVEGGLLAADELDAVQDFGGRVVEIIGDDDFVVILQETEGREGADVACTTTMSPSVPAAVSR